MISNFTGCCGATILSELEWLTVREIQRQIRGNNATLAISARQPAAEKNLKLAGFHHVATVKGSHGNYGLKIWVKGEDFKLPTKPRAVKAKAKAKK